MHDEWKDSTIPFYLGHDASKEDIFTQLEKLSDKRGDEWFDTLMRPEDCALLFNYERDILFLTHIANSLMRDEGLHDSKVVVQTLEEILTAIQLLQGEAAAYRYPFKHDIHVISERIRSFISGHEG